MEPDATANHPQPAPPGLLEDPRLCALLQTTLDDLPVEALVADTGGRVRLVNRLLRERIGPREFEGHHCHELLFDRTGPCLEGGADCPLRQVVEGGLGRVALHQVAPAGGETTLVELRLTPLKNEAGRVEAVIFALSDISERQRREEALRRREEQYRLLFLDAPLPYQSLDGEGRFLEVNEAWLELFGCRREEVLGRSFGEFMRPDQLELLGKRFRRFKSTGRVHDARFVMQRPDGVTLPVTVDGIIEAARRPDEGLRTHCILRDLSKEQRDEEERRRLFAVIEQAWDAICITDAQGLIEYVNPAFARISGYGAEELLGRKASVIKSGVHDERFYRGLWETITAGKAWQGTIVNRRKNGELFQELVTITPVIGEDGRIRHFAALKRDVTHERELEERLRQAQKLESIGTLAGGIAHDFNNILQAVQGHAELARLTLEPGHPACRSLAEILGASQRAAALVQRLLAFSRRAPQERQLQRLQPLIEEAGELLRGMLPASIRLETRLDPQAGSVSVDATQIQQVLINLGTNAYHAMKARGGRLRISLDQDSDGLEAPAGTQWLRLGVSDEGVGMAPDVLARVFDPYYTTRAPGEGSGLGLAVVHGIVESHGGQIRIESQPDCGTKVWVWLQRAGEAPGSMPAEGPRPAQAAPESGRAAPPAQPRTGGGPGLAPQESPGLPSAEPGPRVLAVDDEPQVARLLQRALEAQGFAVVVCTDPLAALERLQHETFDLLLSDQTMPDLSGVELIRQARERQPALRTVLCTGHSAMVDEAQAAEFGIDLFLRKPYSVAELGPRLRALLAEGR
jgi:PAS domain S-box-containing protein